MPEPLRFGTIGRTIFVAHTGKTSPAAWGRAFLHPSPYLLGKRGPLWQARGMRTFSYGCIIENG